MELDHAWAAGAYRVLEVKFRVISTGSASQYVKLVHAPVNEKDAYQDLEDGSGTPVRVEVSSGGNAYWHVPSFMRYVRWAVTGGTGDPIVQVDIVAKE